MSARSAFSSPVVQALFVTFLWSTSWVLIKLGLSDDLPPLTFAGLRYSLAAVVLGGVLATSPVSRRQLAATSWPARGRLIALGLVMYALTQGAQFVGLDLLPAATLSLLLSFTPVVVTLGSGRMVGEGAGVRQWVGMVVAAGGAAIYLGSDIRVTSALGLGVGLVGLASNAGASLLGRVVNRDAALSPLAVTAPSMAVGGTVTLVTGLLMDGLPHLTLTTWAIVIWLAVVNTAFAFTLWNRTLQSLTATESAAINNTMLVQIAVLAWLVLGEGLSSVQWFALLVVSIGIWLVRRRE
jgi:drug/metabolite transporter (DMT)-like permease